MIERYLKGAKAQDLGAPGETLTARERQVLTLLFAADALKKGLIRE